MNLFLESLHYTIPAIVVLATSYLLIRQFFDKELRQQKHELLINNQKLITPIRLQAYERMVLLLERISPENLLTRIYVPGMTTGDIKNEAIRNIKSEFEHNLSQQVYISGKSWELIKMAKENMIKLLNIAGNKFESKTPATEYSKLVLQMYFNVEDPPLKVALEHLKNEFSETFTN
jgi:hypothetical protein